MPLANDSARILAGCDETTRWFLAEIADAPVPQSGEVSLVYALELLRGVLGVADDHSCLERLLQALQQPDNRRVLEQAQRRRAQGACEAYELRLPAEGGETAVLRASPRPIRTADGATVHLAALEDVTQDCRQRLAQEASQEKFRVLFEIFPIGITISDDQGRILQANPASEAILGLPASHHLSRMIDGGEWRILRPDGSPMPPEEFASVRALKSREVCSNDVMGIERPDGQTRWISVTAAPLPLQGHGVVIAYVDITRSREASEALRVKERRYRLAVEAGKVCIWEWNQRTGDIHLDPLIHAILGYEPEELHAAEDWLELVHPEDRPRFAQTLERHLEGQADVFEFEHRKLHKNGGFRWFLSRGVALADNAGGLVLSGADLDITQRKHAEQAVEEERKRLFSLLDRLPAFVCLLAPDASIRFANRYFSEIVSTVAALEEYENMHADSGDAPGPLQEIFDTRSLSIWEWSCQSTGRIYQMYGYPFQDIDGSPLVLELGIDITSSKRAQEALRASEERYRSIAENLALGLVILDGEMRLRAANPRLRQWLGHADLDAAPYCYDVLCARNHGEICADCPVPLVQRDGLVREALREVPLPEGVRRMQMTYSPIFDQEGRVDSVILLVEDVTEKLEVQARLQRAHKLEAMGTLAGGIAHEINQPLNALQLYASGLEMLVEKDRQPDRETLLARLGWIMRECDRIHEIISHMRALVHQEAGPAKPGAANLNECVEAALSLLTAQLKAHGIGLELHLEPGLPEARANPVQLEQVVINLVVNAMQALDSLEAAASRDAADSEARKRITVSTGRQDSRLLLTVQDTGPGLQGLEDRMFDPFFTSKDAGKGMGLGLSIVHTFVESWGGEIRGRTRDSGGAEFSVRLLQAL